MFRLSALLATTLLLAASAAVFPDVPEGNPFKEDIEALVRAGIVNGNPDGNFYPDRTVNRAEMLKMLYLASGRTPEPGTVGCFSDVVRYSWYEAYVCDAAKNNFVKGYGDGTFHPDQEVNRVEALKMLFEVMELPAPPVSEADRDVIKFVDISIAAWYTRYIFAAFTEGILPVAGQSGSHFYPEAGLRRGEAAAYIATATNLDLQQHRAQQPQEQSQKSSQAAGSAVTAEEEDVANTKYMAFPFEDNDRFAKKNPKTYLFTLSSAKTVMAIRADITGAIASDVVCRLYLLRDDGFSEEYYLGLQEDTHCVVTAVLGPGDYQLHLQPTAADAYYSVSAKTVTGDGNDGFMEAKPIKKNTAYTESLVAHDVYDWFKFTVATEGQYMLEVSSSRNVRCIIYSPLTIDLYGFADPKCNEYYTYKPGTYTVGITHDPPLDKLQTYTIKFR